MSSSGTLGKTKLKLSSYCSWPKTRKKIRLICQVLSWQLPQYCEVEVLLLLLMWLHMALEHQLHISWKELSEISFIKMIKDRISLTKKPYFIIVGKKGLGIHQLKYISKVINYYPGSFTCGDTLHTTNNAQWATMCQFGKNEFYNWENTGNSFKTTVILQSLRKCISFFIWTFKLKDICT